MKFGMFSMLGGLLIISGTYLSLSDGILPWGLLIFVGAGMIYLLR